MKLQHIALVCLLALSAGNVTAQMLHRPDSMYTFTDPRLQKNTLACRCRNFRNECRSMGIRPLCNERRLCQNQYRQHTAQYQAWFCMDNDQFSTNLFAHPYHGNLYFNAARSNGLTFWESAPYAFAGSLMWEIAAEVEPPAINDLMATT